MYESRRETIDFNTDNEIENNEIVPYKPINVVPVDEHIVLKIFDYFHRT